MLLSMAPKLLGVRRPRFSETARSHPRPREAVRHDGPDNAAVAVLRRRLADDLAERAAERAQAREPDVEADLGHALVRLAEQEHRALDAPALEVAMRRLA